MTSTTRIITTIPALLLAGCATQPAPPPPVVAEPAVAAPAVAAPTAAHREPGIHEVYEVAASGHVDQALQMMREVLQQHPNSAKAHYVEAELLSRNGDAVGARAELAKAERLAPGLPFASAQSQEALRAELAVSAGAPSDR